MSYLEQLKKRLNKVVGKPASDLEMAKVCCPQCGTCADVDLNQDPEDGNWLPCAAPKGFEWILPAGKISPVVGEALYVDALGAQYTRKAYRAKYNIDPEIAYIKMREKKTC